ncbi:UNVERIFIED_CONTAM: hypothetical protein GTU68_037087 [Idotea baltica]|nr:hypothetical protein [Idotea baltica]
MAPSAATADMYLRDGKADTELSQTGPLAVAVPGALAAYAHALRSHGEKTLADVMLPAAKIAEEGFAVDKIFARKLESKKDLLAAFPATRDQLLKSDGSPYQTGDTLRQSDLAKTYRSIAVNGEKWFYEGPFAQTIGSWMHQNGGIVTAEDFANYRIKLRQPVVTDYRDWKIVGFPPPSSGGCHVAQMLNILETFDLAAMHQRDPAQAKHVVIESMKRAFADRAYHLGDADFSRVPKALIDKAYARDLAKQIDIQKSTDVSKQGDPFAFGDELFGKHTTHIAAADSDGYWVAITATVNTTFGSKVIVPGTGLILNNEMDDFSAQPGVPNAFGLIGAENNAIAPGKRPLSSMSPTIVLDRRAKPIMTVGAAGGPKIITQVLLALIRTLDYGDDLQAAVAGPRFHHQWRPDSVLVESKMGDEIIDRLKKFGHAIKTTSSSGITQAIRIDDDGNLIGVHDPRVPGKVGYGFRKVATVKN